MIGQIEKLLRRLRRLISPAEWLVRLWRLPPAMKDEGRAGLVMIQIDGLSLFELQRAIKSGKLPFLRRLMHRERYTPQPLYTGLPATTPAVQGELFYGVSSIVPAFQYFDRELGRMVNLFEPATAAALEKRLAGLGAGLLQGGSAYSDIFAGGAAEANFCIASAGWNANIPARRLFRIPS